VTKTINSISSAVKPNIRQSGKPPILIHSLVLAILGTSQAQLAWAVDVPTTQDINSQSINTAIKENPETPDNSASPDNLEEVVVSATKTATTLSNSPAAVTVIGQKDLDARNISRLGDALTKVPSLYLGFNAFGQTNGGSGSGVFSLRGLNTQRTLILMDGQPLQDGNSQSVDWRTVMTDDVERVEVVPGAFSTLYGSSAMGGVINVISKNPIDHELTIRGKKGYEAANGQDASIYFREKFENSFGFTGGFSYQDRSGYRNTFYDLQTGTLSPSNATHVIGGIPATTNTGLPSNIIGLQGASPWTQMNATGKLEYAPDDRNHLWAGYSFSDFTMTYSPYTTYLQNAATGAPVSTGIITLNGVNATKLNMSSWTNAAPEIQTSNRFFGGYEHFFDKDITLKANYAWIDRGFTYATAGSSASTSQFGGPGTLSEAPNTGMDANLQVDVPFKLDLLPLGKDHLFISGANFHRETVDRGQYTTANWRDANSIIARQYGYTGNSSIYSIYGQDEITVIKPLKVYLGGRFNWWETEGTFNQIVSPVSHTIFNARSQTNFSPKVSTVYRPMDPVTLRASWGQSFRAPDNLSLYSNTVLGSSLSPTGYSTTTSDPNLSPETATSWEAGGEWRITPKISAGATYYETDLNNMIYTKTVLVNVLSEKINAGQASIRGLELSFGTKPLDWLEFYANWGLVDTKMISNLSDPTTVGKQLTNVPRNTVKAGVIANYGNWSGTLETNHFSHQFSTTGNTDITNNVPGSYSAYTVVNTKLGYKVNSNIKLNAAVNNLFNQTYYQFYLMPGINLTTEIVLTF
jgi:iron complex outermembrane receptor protein